MRHVWLPVLLLLSASPEMKAQGAFEQSLAGAGISPAVFQSELRDYWQTGSGLALYWSVPFYAGDLEFRAGFLPMKSRRQNIPSINNVFTTLNWRMPAELTRRLSVSGGFLIGNNFMYRPSAGIMDGPESEFMAGLTGMIHFRLSPTLSLRAGLEQIRIYTYHKINLTSPQMGIEVHFDSPRWLKQLLQ